VITSTPVSLVTGFLGAGKTTLLNHLLREVDDRRFGVVENEFGSDGIDSELLCAPKETTFELTEGCACCDVRDDLVELFEELPSFEHVLLETSGLAEPGPIMQVFDQPNLRRRYHLSEVITIVDSEHVDADLAEPAAIAQLTYADVLVLNKSDRVSTDELERVAAKLQALNPLARQVRATYSAVSPAELFSTSAGGVDAVMERVAKHQSQIRQRHHHHDDEHHHDEGIVSVSVETSCLIDIHALDRWLERLVRSQDMVLLRMKGVLAVPGGAHRFVFHGVRDVVDVRPDRLWRADEVRWSRAVFIGRGLDPEALKQGFARCSIGAAGTPA